jgi:2-aminobenzoate-CoA ligase
VKAASLKPSAHVDTFAREGLPPSDLWPELNLTGPFAYPDRMNCAVRLLDGAVREGHGDRVAIVSRDANGALTETTYRELQQQADAIAHTLVQDLGLVPGNRVLLRGYNGAMLSAAWFAVMKAGGIAVTTMPMLRATELQAVLTKSRCSIALCDKRLEADFTTAAANCAPMRVCMWGTQEDVGSLEQRMMHHREPFTACATASDDVCLIAFTSGTTGVPKGCMHFHRDVMAMCDSFAANVLRLQPDDRCIGTPPLAFTFGLGMLLVFPMFARASTVLLESATPDILLETVRATKATVTATAPTFYRMMALALQREPSRFDTSSLRQSVSAGEALPLATRDLWRSATGIEMLDGIGATEMIHIFISASGADVRPGAIGKAVPGYEIAVLDADLQRLPLGETGKLAVRGPTGCRYLADDRQKNYVQGGWNLTGDACTMDADGYVFFKARTDDLIISSGYNIGAPEVEAAVLSHEGVAECAVIGVPDAERGQCVTAFVVLKPAFAPSTELVRDIQDHVKRTIAPYKYPRSVVFRDSLPKTETGKLQRFRLREES